MVATVNHKARVLFNPLKHHLNFIRKYIHNYGQKDCNQLKSELLKIGDAQMDLYLGELLIEEITEEVIAFLENLNLLEKSRFFHFTEQNHGFTVISLSDQSTWVLRKGEDASAFVHLHPARYGKHTIRVKATTLKSVIAAKIVLRGAASIGLSEMNEVRVKILNLSPTKYVSPNALKMLNMLNFTNQ